MNNPPSPSSRAPAVAPATPDAAGGSNEYASAGAKSLLSQGLLYGLFGAAQLVADWLAFVVLSYMGVAPALANVVGRIGGAALGFVLNGRFTFRAPDAPAQLHVRSLSKFIISWLLMTLLSTVLVMASVATLGIQATWLTKPLIDLTLAVAGFLISKHWIYR